VQFVDHEILGEAADLFNPLASKKNTLFDAVVAAIAKRLNADAIFSFDGWYRTTLFLLQEKSKIREVFFFSACYTDQVINMRTLVRWCLSALMIA
jgi:hypothetical protein